MAEGAEVARPAKAGGTESRAADYVHSRRTGRTCTSPSARPSSPAAPTTASCSPAPPNGSTASLARSNGPSRRRTPPGYGRLLIVIDEVGPGGMSEMSEGTGRPTYVWAGALGWVLGASIRCGRRRRQETGTRWPKAPVRRSGRAPSHAQSTTASATVGLDEGAFRTIQPGREGRRRYQLCSSSSLWCVAARSTSAREMMPTRRSSSTTGRRLTPGAKVSCVVPLGPASALPGCSPSSSD